MLKSLGDIVRFGATCALWSALALLWPIMVLLELLSFGATAAARRITDCIGALSHNALRPSGR